MPATLTLRNLTEDVLVEWQGRDERRRALEREARQLKTANDLVEARIEQALRDAGKTACRKHGFMLEFKDGRPSVSWKELFIGVAGPDAANAAIDAAPVPQRLTITRETTAADVEA